jgi:hypothetical protein
VSIAIWFAAELLRDRPPERPLRAAAAAAIAAGAADPGDTVSAQMVRTTPQVSPDDRTITVINTGTSRILSEATLLDAFVRPLTRLPRTRVCGAVRSWRALGQAFGSRWPAVPQCDQYLDPTGADGPGCQPCRER